MKFKMTSLHQICLESYIEMEKNVTKLQQRF